jgi:hypothetical protein
VHLEYTMLETTTEPDNAIKLKDIAFYYPNPMWRSGDWVKTLMLFFDGIGLLVPEYMTDRPSLLDPAIAVGLEEHGLLHIITPESVVDADITAQLATALTNIIASGALDSLSGTPTHFAELSWSRIGGLGDPALARMIVDELEARGLARASEDGKSVPMHPLVRSLVLVLLAQLLRPGGAARGLELSPATDRPEIVAALAELLSLPSIPSSGNVVASDLQIVSVDVSTVPMDELLDFRQQHLAESRNYARAVRRFALDLSLLSAPDRDAALALRRSELADLASALRTASERAWRKPASWAMSLAGAAWMVHTGDLFGSFLAGAASLLGGATEPKQVGAYSYLFTASKQF